MSAFTIEGGYRLEGKIRVHGAKNSVLPILAATILCEEECVIQNCPGLSDVDSTLKILRHLGCKAQREGDTAIIDSSGMNRTDIPESLMREMRSSVVFLGAILARAGNAAMSYPGGCELGPRPIDLHLLALQRLGAIITEQGGTLVCTAKPTEGADLHLAFPSVGATENIMLFAAGGKGTTHIHNAAREPEIEDLADFLTALGGKVRGAGTSDITIEGVDRFHSAQHSIIPDRIVAATYLSAAAAAGGDVLADGLNPEHIAAILPSFSEAGCQLDIGKDSVRLQRNTPLRPMKTIRTLPYPGFPTDAQAPLMAVAALANGTTVFVENIFESRYRHVGELSRMGADIKVEGHVAVVCGVPKLYGAPVEATDLRGGAALVAAALGAEGQSVITGLAHIDRGYDGLENDLRRLGAHILRKSG